MLTGIAKEFSVKRTSPFYRKYPVSSQIRSFGAVDRRGAFCREHGFFYNRIPKVANSTIIHNLIVHSGLSASSSYKETFSRPSQMTKDDVNRMRSIFKFVFFRNPESRVLSSYKDKVLRRGYLSAGGKIKNSPFGRYSHAPDFDEFLTYLEGGGLYANAHWAPQASLLLLPFEMFDFVGRFENLRDDLNYVVGKVFGEELGETLEVMGPPKTGASDDYMKTLTEGQRRRIGTLYKEDFNLL